MSIPTEKRGGRGHTAGAYDVRTFIAGLIGVYGIVLVIMGLVANSADDTSKAGGVDANLWAGIVMVVVALAFAVWTWLRPVVVDERVVEEAHAEEDAGNPPAH
jgi:membrane-bound ClpP family serine protease